MTLTISEQLGHVASSSPFSSCSWRFPKHNSSNNKTSCFSENYQPLAQRGYHLLWWFRSGHHTDTDSNRFPFQHRIRSLRFPPRRGILTFQLELVTRSPIRVVRSIQLPSMSTVRPTCWGDNSAISGIYSFYWRFFQTLTTALCRDG